MVFKITLDTEKSVDNFFNSFNFKNFSIDTETSGLDEKKDFIVGISVYDGGKASFYIPVGHKRGKQVNKEYVVPKLIEKFKYVEELILQNSKFDIKFLKRFLGVDCFENLNYVDSMLAHYLLDENDRHGLKYLASKFLGKDPTKYDDVAKNYDNASHIPIKDIAPYACDDAINTWSLYKLFEKRLKEEKLYDIFKLLKCLLLR